MAYQTLIPGGDPRRATAGELAAVSAWSFPPASYRVVNVQLNPVVVPAPPGSVTTGSLLHRYLRGRQFVTRIPNTVIVPVSAWSAFARRRTIVAVVETVPVPVRIQRRYQVRAKKGRSAVTTKSENLAGIIDCGTTLKSYKRFQRIGGVNQIIEIEHRPVPQEGVKSRRAALRNCRLTRHLTGVIKRRPRSLLLPPKVPRSNIVDPFHRNAW